MGFWGCFICLFVFVNGFVVCLFLFALLFYGVGFFCFFYKLQYINVTILCI